MAFYNKIGALILNDQNDKFLVCEPGSAYSEKSVKQFIMPGGQLEGESDEECLRREIKEELDCEIEDGSIKYINEYTDMAASGQGRDVMIRLYQCRLSTEPQPSAEIGALHWLGSDDSDNERVSPIIRNKIIPDLIEKKILK